MKKWCKRNDSTADQAVELTCRWNYKFEIKIIFSENKLTIGIIDYLKEYLFNYLYAYLSLTWKILKIHASMAPPMPAFKTKANQEQMDVEKLEEMERWKLSLEQNAKYDKMLTQKIEEVNRERVFQATKISLLDSVEIVDSLNFLQSVSSNTISINEGLVLQWNHTDAENTDNGETESGGVETGSEDDILIGIESVADYIVEMKQELEAEYESNILNLKQEIKKRYYNYNKN